jgi:hypothetical protein
MPLHWYPTTPTLSITTHTSANTQWAAAELPVQHEVLMTENNEGIDSDQQREENEPVGVAL